MGTSRPCRYFVMRNDIEGITNRDNAYLCYEMAYLYGRCQKAVSLPAPLYYAHLFTERVRFLTSDFIRSETGAGWLSDSQSVSDTLSDTSSTRTGEQNMPDFASILDMANKHAADLSDKTQPMFYC